MKVKPQIHSDRKSKNGYMRTNIIFWGIFVLLLTILGTVFVLASKGCLMTIDHSNKKVINWDLINVTSSLFCGLLSVWAVNYTIKIAQIDRKADQKMLEDDRIKARKELEHDRKEEEQKKCIPFFEISNQPTGCDNLHSVRLKTSDHGDKQYYITTLTDAIGIVKFVVSNKEKHEILLPQPIGKRIEGVLCVERNLERGDYLVAEDILGNHYRYDIITNENWVSFTLPVLIDDLIDCK